MFKKSTWVAGLALCAALAPHAARAGLIGDSVTGSLSADPDWGVVTPFSQPCAVVGAGAEFQGRWVFAPWSPLSTQSWDITVDVGADTITVSAYETTAAADNVYAPAGQNFFAISLGSLDLGQDITGVTQRPGPSGVTIGFSAHAVALTWSALPFGSGDFGPHGGTWVFDLLPAVGTAPTGPGTGTVPEPGSLALALPALLGLAAARRRPRG